MYKVIEKKGLHYAIIDDKEVLLESYPSAETREHYKKEYKHTFKDISKDGKWCILRSPTLIELNAGKTVAKGRGMQFDIFLKDNCKLLNSPEFDSSDEHILGLLEWLGLIIKTVDGELGEL